jgi:hypothetical protein
MSARRQPLLEGCVDRDGVRFNKLIRSWKARFLWVHITPANHLLLAMKSAPISRHWRLLTILLTALLLSQVVAAQSRVYLGLSGLIGSPRADFGGYGAENAYGGHFMVGISPSGLPMVFGATFGAMIYGYESRWETLSDQIPDLDVKVINTNNIAQGHLFVRLQPHIGRVQPYIEMLAGANVFFTVTYIDNNYEGGLSSTNYDDTAFSMGPGGGLFVRLWGGHSESGHPINVVLDAGITYLFGSEADYLLEGAIERSPGEVGYQVTHSRTNLLSGRIGLVFQF